MSCSQRPPNWLARKAAICRISLKRRCAIELPQRCQVPCNHSLRKNSVAALPRRIWSLTRSPSTVRRCPCRFPRNESVGYFQSAASGLAGVSSGCDYFPPSQSGSKARSKPARMHYQSCHPDCGTPRSYSGHQRRVELANSLSLRLVFHGEKGGIEKQARVCFTRTPQADHCHHHALEWLGLAFGV